MADPEHLVILNQGLEAWNKWRKDNPNIRPGLFGAHLIGADLHGMNFEDANIGCAKLGEANLSKADLGGADLGGDHHSIRATHGATDLQHANLREAHLFETSFSGSDLREADLRGTHMHGASFVATQLAGADLTDSRLSFTTFHGVDLSEAKGLDALHHDGPSIIDIDTIFRSKGRIPGTFLRGAGVPDDFIGYVQSLVVRDFGAKGLRLAHFGDGSKRNSNSMTPYSHCSIHRQFSMLTRPYDKATFWRMQSQVCTRSEWRKVTYPENRPER